MNLPTNIKICIQRNIALSRYSSMHVGGLANYFAEPRTYNQLSEVLSFAQQENLPWMVIGGCSNILFSDDGFSGVIICMRSYEMDRMFIDTDISRITMPSSMPLHALVRFCREKGLGGCEFLCTIPGTLGGAIVMNAGFSRSPSVINQIGDWIHSVRILQNSTRIEFSRDELHFQYRNSNLRGKLILDATLQLKPKSEIEIAEEIRLFREHRLRIQPIHQPSCGSVFKNPSAEVSAGKIIDSLGLKGYRIGGAMISQDHANYMVNMGNAKSSDFFRLIEHVQNVVLNETGIVLETEVILA